MVYGYDIPHDERDYDEEDRNELLKDREDDDKFERSREDEREAMDLDDENNFEPCSDCDQPDACFDFGCAIENGIRRPNF
jgi:hypothetical protein